MEGFTLEETGLIGGEGAGLGCCGARGTSGAGGAAYETGVDLPPALLLGASFRPRCCGGGLAGSPASIMECLVFTEFAGCRCELAAYVG